MLASTKKLQAALGRKPEEEQRPQMHRLAPHLKGFAGLLFTELPRSDVEAAVKLFERSDYARAGSRATHTVRSLPCAVLICYCLFAFSALPTRGRTRCAVPPLPLRLLVLVCFWDRQTFLMHVTPPANVTGPVPAAWRPLERSGSGGLPGGKLYAMQNPSPNL
jgi:hypothetical protein